jgi:putative ABC transport system substrate-binding protein
MKRRELMLLLLGGSVRVARSSRAQQKAMPVIGFLGGEAPGALAANVAAFRQGLVETGYRGTGFGDRIPLGGGRYDRLPGLAAELVGRKVDVIVTYGASAIDAAKSATSTIPIVFFGGGDPVAVGLVASLARPGGNLTGVSIMAPELNPKRLDLLSELVPQAERIALLVNPNNSSAERTIQDLQEAAHAKGVHLAILKAGVEGDFDTAFASVVQLRAGALVIGSDAYFFSRRGSLWPWRHSMSYPRSMMRVSSSRRAAWSAMDRASQAPGLRSAFTPGRS